MSKIKPKRKPTWTSKQRRERDLLRLRDGEIPRGKDKRRWSRRLRWAKEC